jgi:hypothetical protein
MMYQFNDFDYLVVIADSAPCWVSPKREAVVARLGAQGFIEACGENFWRATEIGIAHIEEAIRAKADAVVRK